MIAPARSRADSDVLRLQFITLGWMLIECSVALTAAWKARSVSLLAFGSDSLVELVSAVVVLLQFSPKWRIDPGRAARACGTLLYILAGIVTVIATVGSFYRLESDTSKLGIAVTAVALVLMPQLARLKRKAAARLDNKALRADAVQSVTCAYLAAITLVGLLSRAAFGLHWFDQIAAFAAVPILIVEGRRAREGHTCGCC
jgi:divalent metal cation (Fe/Co/Zn/Cd) transporter